MTLAVSHLLEQCIASLCCFVFHVINTIAMYLKHCAMTLLLRCTGNTDQWHTYTTALSCPACMCGICTLATPYAHAPHSHVNAELHAFTACACTRHVYTSRVKVRYPSYCVHTFSSVCQIVKMLPDSQVQTKWYLTDVNTVIQISRKNEVASLEKWKVLGIEWTLTGGSLVRQLHMTVRVVLGGKPTTEISNDETEGKPSGSKGVGV